MNIWNFNYLKNISFDNLESNETYLLNLNKDTFDDLEKYVYDVALFHFNNLNIKLNETHYVEFWVKEKFDNDKQFHVDCDEFIKNNKNKFEYPLLSIVSYLSDSLKPLVITDITIEEKKFKKFSEKNKIKMIFPKENTQITFNPIYLHGVINFMNDDNHSRYIIAINLWNKKPENVNYYESNEKNNSKNENLIKIYNKDNDLEIININNNIFNFDFYEKLLYNSNNFTLNNELVNLISDKLKENKYIFEINCLSNNDIEKEETNNIINLKNNRENIINEINEIIKLENIDSDLLLYNRFLQRFVYKNIYSPNVCEWIINQADEFAKLNNGWTTKRHDNYPTTDLPVEEITSIFPFIVFSLKSIFNKISEEYFLPDFVGYNVVDLFIVKYSENNQDSLNLHRDGSFLTFNISLSNKDSYEGGGTFFIDGIHNKLNEGDMLVHSGFIKHAGIKITKGTRYLLVGFINLNIANC